MERKRLERADAEDPAELVIDRDGIDKAEERVRAAHADRQRRP